MDFWSLLFDIGILLSGAFVFGAICSRLGQSPIVGYLVAGMALAGLVKADADIEVIAELGVSLLLFSIGLEFSWKRLLGLGTRTLLGGVLQVIVTLFVVAAICYAFGLAGKASLAMGAMIALSSTACVLRILSERAELDAPHGRGGLAILLVQDMAVVPLALLMTSLGETGTASEIIVSTGKMLGIAVGLIVGLYVILNQVAGRLFDALGHGRDRELVILLGLLVGVGSAWVAHYFKLSPSIGTFVAGMALAGSPFAIQVRADVASMRVVLLTLFFAAAGMAADPAWILENLWLVLPVSLGMMVGKTLLVWGILRAVGRTHSEAIATGICVAQIGEFAFVLGHLASEGNVINDDLINLVVSCAIVTLLATPFLMPLAPRMGALVHGWFGSGQAVTGGTQHEEPAVLLIGFGPSGQHVGRAMAEHNIPTTVIDMAPTAANTARALGLGFELGDASHPDVIEHFVSEKLRMVVITIPSPITAVEILLRVRRIAPRAHTVIRSRYEAFREQCAEAGAHMIIVDEHEAGVALAAEASTCAATLIAEMEEEAND